MHALLAPLSFLALSAAGFAQDAPPQDPAQPPKAEANAATEKPAPKTLELGQRIDGELSLRDIDGQEQKAKDLMGKVTVINFYSIQCPVQAQWDERLAQIQKDFAEQGVVFLHIDSNVTEIGEKAPEQPSLRDMPPHSPRSRRCRRPWPTWAAASVLPMATATRLTVPGSPFGNRAGVRSRGESWDMSWLRRCDGT